MNETEPASPNFRMVGFAAAWAAGLTMLGLIVGGGVEQLAGAISTTGDQCGGGGPSRRGRDANREGNRLHYYRWDKGPACS